jgi:hypothetical protein
MAVQYRGEDDQPIMWRPSVESFGALVLAYLRDNSDQKEKMYQNVITMYKDVLVQKEDRRLHLVGRDALHENAQSMLLVLEAIIGLADLTPGKTPLILRDLATSIVQLDCFTADGELSKNLLRDNRAATRALQVSRSWLAQTINNTNLPI